MVFGFIPGKSYPAQVVIALIAVIPVCSGGMKFSDHIPLGCDILADLGPDHLIIKEKSDIIQLRIGGTGTVIADIFRFVQEPFERMETGLETNGFIWHV